MFVQDGRVTWAFYTRSLDIEMEQRGRSHNDRSGVATLSSPSSPSTPASRSSPSITSDKNPWPRKRVPVVVHVSLSEQSPLALTCRSQPLADQLPHRQDTVTSSNMDPPLIHFLNGDTDHDG